MALVIVAMVAAFSMLPKVGQSRVPAHIARAAAAARPAKKAAARRSAAASAAVTAAGAASATTSTSSASRLASLPAPIAKLTPLAAGGTLHGPRTSAVPILMYHKVGVAPAGSRYPGLYVTPTDFIAQLRYLSDHGFRAVTLQQVYDFWHAKGTLPAHPVVISFDDGNANDFKVVTPLLDELHWPGVLNLIATTGPQTKMPITEVRTMVAHGWEIDSHTVNHVDLTTLTPARLKYELTASRAKLRRIFGVPVNFFCYPSGRFNSTVAQAVHTAGYLGATTTVRGFARPGAAFTLKRIRVFGGERIAGFANEVSSPW